MARAGEHVIKLRACLELRFEFDVRRARGGEPVCIHDGTVDRRRNGEVSELTLAGIRRLNSPEFAGDKVMPLRPWATHVQPGPAARQTDAAPRAKAPLPLNKASRSRNVSISSTADGESPRKEYAASQRA